MVETVVVDGVTQFTLVAVVVMASAGTRSEKLAWDRPVYYPLSCRLHLSSRSTVQTYDILTMWLYDFGSRDYDDRSCKVFLRDG
jgi:hypothetical protein